MRISRALARAAFVVLALALAGCASLNPVGLKAEQAGALDTITIVRPPRQQEPVVQNFAHPGMMFGLIGGAIAAADARSKSAEFNKLAAAQGFSFADVLGAAVERRLKDAGYQVRVIDGPWVESDGKYTLANDQLPAGAPVLVLATAIVGYVATVSDDYMPSVWLAARLLGGDRASEIYRGYHSTGWAPSSGEWKYAKAARSFRNFEALVANPAESTAALTEAAETVAASLAEDLRRPGRQTAQAALVE